MNTSDTLRALVLTALMVLAPVAGTVALSGDAAATAADDVTVTSAGDVQIGQSSTPQSVTFDATLSAGNTTNVSFAASGVSGLTLNGVSGPSSSNGNITASVVGSDVQLTNTAGSSQTTAVTVTLDWDTTGVSSTTSGGAATLTADGEGTTGTGSFDVVGTSAPADSVSVTSAQNVSVGQSSTTQTVEFDTTLSAGNSTDFTFSSSAGGLSLTGVSVNSVGNPSVDASTSGTTLTLSNTGGSQQSTSVNVDLTWDSTGASTASGVTLTVDGGGTTDTGSFDLVSSNVAPTGLTVTYAGDVTAEQSSTTQTVQFETTLAAGDSTTFGFTPSGAGLSQTPVLAARKDASSVTIASSGTDVTLTNTAGSQQTVTATVVLEWDSTGVSPTAGDAITLTVGGEGVTATGGFDALSVDDRKRSVHGGSGRVFLGEENVDLTGLDAVDPTASTVTFEGVSGQAEDEAALATVDPASADITESNGFVDGGFSVSGSSGDVDLRVSEPNVFDAFLYLGSGTGGADITNGSIPTGSNTVTVEAEYNFEDAERVEIVVIDEDGLDITGQLIPSGQDAFIDRNGGTQELDLSGLEPGTYNVTIQGESDLEDARREVSFTVREQVNSLSLENTELTQGATTVVTAQGTPGDVVHVRIDADDTEGTDDNATARRVFRSSGDVAARFGSADVGSTGTEYVAAAVELDDNGEGRLRIDTEALSTGGVEIELALGPAALDEAAFRAALANESEVSADLEINERTLTLNETPSSIFIGESFTVTGTAPETDVVKAYVRLDSQYIPLREEGDTQPAQDFVDSDGDFEIEIGTGGELRIPDSYRITVVGNPVANGIDYADDADDDSDGTPNHFEELDRGTVADFEPQETFTIRTGAGEMTARLSSPAVAVDTGDEVVLSGNASGQGDSVRVYIIGPRGVLYELDGTRKPSPGGGGSARDWYDTVSIRNDNAFEESIENIDRRGTYRVIVIGQGRDGSYTGDPTGLAAKSQQQGVEIIQAAYDDAGSDDVIVALTLNAESPLISVDLASGQRLPNAEVTIEGTSNREDGTPIFVELLDNESNAIATGEGEVDGEADTWSAEIDLSGVEPGTYTLRATDDESAVRVEVEVVDGPVTATPEPGTPTEEPITVTSTPTATPTPTATRTLPPTIEEPTDVNTPGFTAITALVALLVIALAALAPRRD